MKTVIVALNSKYIHSSLAPWYLKSACKDSCEDIKVLEFTINDDIEWMLIKIFMEKPNAIGFSCYIWNITQILRLASNLKQISPHCKIILGGPEVSFEPEQIMQTNPFIDYIICGEGEISFSKLLRYLSSTNVSNNNNYSIKGSFIGNTNANANANVNTGKGNGDSVDTNTNKDNDSIANIDAGSNTDRDTDINADNNIDVIEGLSYRQGNKIIYDGRYCLIEDLDSLPSPYTNEMVGTLNNKIVYYETSRGCPFACSYCLSSTFNGVRYYSMDRVKKDLLYFMDIGVEQVKFVDRTFNCNKKRSREIIKFIIDKDPDMNFHFEAAGDLFDEETLKLLALAKEGLIQLEIGVQSVNEKTLKEINRKTDLQKIYENVKLLISNKNIHLHLDLITGLPYENYNSVQKSFNKVYELKPHKLQLGFLKMLKGTRMREQAKNHGYRYREYPPYEILYNKYIGFNEIAEFKGIERIFEMYYNSGRFINTLNYIIEKYCDKPFKLYKELYLYSFHRGYLDKALPAGRLYTIFNDFAKNFVPITISKNTVFEAAVLQQEFDIINDLLKFDFVSTNNSGNLPEGIESIIEPDYKSKRLDFIYNEENRARYFPQFKGSAPKQLLKYINIVAFKYDIDQFINFNRHESEITIKDSETLIKKGKTSILFNYSKKNKVTGVYKYHKIEF